jgi:hypothetical protein
VTEAPPRPQHGLSGFTRSVEFASAIVGLALGVATIASAVAAAWTETRALYGLAAAAAVLLLLYAGH